MSMFLILSFEQLMGFHETLCDRYRTHQRPISEVRTVINKYVVTQTSELGMTQPPLNLGSSDDV
jgi:hypothetical protein